MKLRNGQVAYYLVAVILAVLCLAILNFGVFLSVRAKNRAMNAGDAAALAVARYQGELLNRIGRINLEHLKAAVENDQGACDQIMEDSAREGGQYWICFIDPLDGIRLAGEQARANGVDKAADSGMADILREHLADIDSFSSNPELYPEPWPNAWQDYKIRLESILNGEGDLVAGPDNVEFADIRSCFPLASGSFYNAIAGRMWCWFHFNGEWMLDCDVSSMPMPDFHAPAQRFNSEINSLHLRFAPLPEVLDPQWIAIISHLTGCSASEIASSTILTNQSQRFAFYDSRWSKWSTYPGVAFNPTTFPIDGEVRPEYDVYGAASICRVTVAAPDLFADEDAQRVNAVNWTGAAKPFGTVVNLEGETDVVTAFRSFVTPAFTDVRLVPVDAAGGRNLRTADRDWMLHVKEHVPGSMYFSGRNDACWYCQQLNLWDSADFRRTGADWLAEHVDACERGEGDGEYYGGTAHAH